MARNKDDIVAKVSQKIADRILEGTIGAFSLCCVRLPKSGLYRILGVAGVFPRKNIIPLDFKAGQGGTGGTVVKTGVPRLAHDYLIEYASSPFRKTADSMSVRSLIIAPVGKKLPTYGVLYVIGRQPNMFTRGDLNRLIAEARVAEVALEMAMDQAGWKY